MAMNIQHPTSNIQRPKRSPVRRFIGCSVLDVGSWMFFLLAFSVLPLFAQAPTNALPALAPPDGEIPPTFWEQHGTMILLAGIALIAAAVLILWKIFQPRPAVVRPPEILAREALTKLLNLPEDGRHLSEVSQILRHYFIAAFELPAAELTTTEFCAALAASEKIGGELAGIVAGFLRECDERKFSPRPATPLNAAARALELVARAGSQPVQPAAPQR
jgi:hypothetical protein